MVTILFDRARISLLLNDVLNALSWENYGTVSGKMKCDIANCRCYMQKNQTNKKRKTSSVQMSTLFFSSTSYLKTDTCTPYLKTFKLMCSLCLFVLTALLSKKCHH